MKKALFTILGMLFVVIVFFGLPWLYESIFTNALVCAEGCSPAFRIFVFACGLLSLIFGGVIGYLYAKTSINTKQLAYITFIFLAFHTVVVWYSTGLGYGIHNSY
ncbi:hypothetical protein [Acinetobacter proteolyticus]|uniref:Uncharacterized protein n=1 Tax=Acinetobacter proteolyticus TaxID=1776741 RepID=A0A2N0WI81_9GAMM|nr:hypothetical protein [Acinetobacter proteolyticus]MBK5646242.1 hypothetical protein [Acinetobacter sp.]PKF35509.1 hypothetical protein CW311_04260 [Acinetobacter proteolyticus]